MLWLHGAGDVLPAGQTFAFASLTAERSSSTSPTKISPAASNATWAVTKVTRLANVVWTPPPDISTNNAVFVETKRFPAPSTATPYALKLEATRIGVPPPAGTLYTFPLYSSAIKTLPAPS